MENFTAYTPTTLHFGRDVIKKLGKTINNSAKKVLLVYGRNSIKEHGIYERIVNQLNDSDISFVEYSGIKPNPILEDVEKAAELGRREKVDMIIAVGGGSVIDSAKIISVSIKDNTNPWDFVSGKTMPTSNIPLVSVLTLAATGTEMNCFAVLQNPADNKKLGYGHPLLYPKHSFLDPQFTVSVPKDQTAYGIVDLIAHSLEAYFGGGEASLSDRFVIAIIKEALEYGPQLINNPNDYDLRAKIMYAATCALNGLTYFGRYSPDWGVHSFGHDLSLLFDLAHGATLSIGYYAWFRLQKDRIPDRLNSLFSELFGTLNVEDGIGKMEAFFKQIGSPVKLTEAGINENEKSLILETMTEHKVSGLNHKLDENDLKTMLNYCF